ncbi:MAG: peptidoglycan DD-metalloendopeptidase family protein [Azoarcus sp.]|jgi:septal ring factor EnvC (AmiA/AmiB activator)|nr:peptidoglycan DD-metalloendopeptidase family protein [Azoarcus sp.]
MNLSSRRALAAVLAFCAGMALSAAPLAAPAKTKAKTSKTAKPASKKSTKPAAKATPAAQKKPAAQSKAAEKAAQEAKAAKAAQEAKAAKAELGAKRSDLKDVKRRIGDAQRDVQKNEEALNEASTAVSAAERDVSKATRALRQVTSERAEVERQLQVLETEQRDLEARIASRHEELGVWLRRNYIYGAGNDIASLLSAGDPNQISRDAYYLERLGRARKEMIESLRADQRIKAERAAQIEQRHEILARLEKDRARKQEELERTHASRRETMEKIAADLKSRRDDVGALKADEARLTSVIDTLSKQAAAAEAEAKAAAKRARELALSRQNTVADRMPRYSDERPVKEPVVGRVREAASSSASGSRFAQQRGNLQFPVAGELIGRFGARRAGQATAWRGVFIRAANGAQVRAVSDGEVVYSDWLRGYGNLLILDHGDGYLSIYGNNDALFKEVGQSVRGGEAIASVGSSGVEGDSGLYFEIRHRGQAVDPMQWVRLK